jgi:hypothetical protein
VKFGSDAALVLADKHQSHATRHTQSYPIVNSHFPSGLHLSLSVEWLVAQKDINVRIWDLWGMDNTTDWKKWNYKVLALALAGSFTNRLSRDDIDKIEMYIQKSLLKWCFESCAIGAPHIVMKLKMYH